MVRPAFPPISAYSPRKKWRSGNRRDKEFPREAILPAPLVAVALIQEALTNGLHAAYVVWNR